MVSCLKSGESAFGIGGCLYLFYGKVDDRVDLCDFSLKVSLGDLKKLSFRRLQEIIDVIALVESVSFDFRGKGYKASRKICLLYTSPSPRDRG